MLLLIFHFFLGRQRDEHHHHQPVCEREITPSSLGGSKNISPVRQNSACVAKRSPRSSRIYTRHKKMNFWKEKIKVITSLCLHYIFGRYMPRKMWPLVFSPLAFLPKSKTACNPKSREAERQMGHLSAEAAHFHENGKNRINTKRGWKMEVVKTPLFSPPVIGFEKEEEGGGGKGLSAGFPCVCVY